VRGDWQIAAWIFPWTPSARGLAYNVLPAIARFKILDNLRRSLVPPALIALLAGGWLRGRSMSQALTSTGSALLPLALPLLLDLAGALVAVARGPRRRSVLRAQAEQLRLGALRFGLNIAFLPDQAVSNLDAIGRTLVRLLVSRRNLLQWETAEAAHTRLTSSWRALLERMAPLAVAAAIAALVRGQRLTATWPAAAPVIADWLAAPALAAWLDQPHMPKAHPLASDDQLLLRRLARRTWAYFEEFVKEEANHLAPDNFQETPSPLAALRTSPTNIGIQLLADLAAYDFGYIGVAELTERTERVFATLARMERHRGHLLNWYDTVTLQPMPPAYISTVDSGNLAGALLVLRQAYLELRDQPVVGPRMLAGLRDTLVLAQEQLPAEDTRQQRLSALADLLAEMPAMPADYVPLLRTVEQSARDLSPDEPGDWLARLASQARSFLRDIEQLTGGDDGDSDGLPAPLLNRHVALADEALAQVLAMDFAFLYDEQRRLFVIGHSLAEGRRDSSFYDLLASEARLASFLAIAKGDVPQEHWFHLGRTLLDSGAGTTLASWSGTMFEYLMPLLVMRTYPGTLLDSSYQVAVARQIQYGREQQVPWGISESAYNARDPAMNYQYRAFGVPGLGLKRALAGDLVVAPYATALAVTVQPPEALANLSALIDSGMLGRYGLYEAIDFTPDRLPPGTHRAIVRSYMVHHQGMSLLAFANSLHANSMQRRFHAEPLVQATEMLLQEQVVSAAPHLPLPDIGYERPAAPALDPAVRHVTTPTTALPYTHLLSNGAYTVMLTNAGGGYSMSDSTAVTRWRSDVVRDNWGSFCYIRDVRSDLAWSAAYQPTRHEAQDFRAIFGLDKVEFRQLVAGIETRMEITVSPEDNVEVRRISLTNLTSAPRELEVTSYAELVLAPAAADAAHPAFSNLFVETEFVPEHDALLASRRPRVASDTRLWALHVIAVRGHAGSVTEYETDRAAFLGRGRTTSDPLALHAPLGAHVGAVLDPIFSLRRRLRIPPGSTAQVTFTTGVAGTRDQALQLADRYRDPEAAARAMNMAWADVKVELRHLNISPADAQRFQRLAASVLYLDHLKRARPEVLAQNTRGQAALWAYGISGDEPIVLVRVASGADLSLVQELLQAHQYWRLKQFKVDLVLVNEEAGGYMLSAQDRLLGLVRSGGSSAWLNQRGGVFVLRADVIAEEDLVLLQTAARVVLSTGRGGLAQHLRRRDVEVALPPPPPYRADGGDSRPLLSAEGIAEGTVELCHRTPYGGFDADGAFVIDLAPGQNTPAPWSNVVANQRFGFIVTERGGGYTWAGNSRENRLTPWSNDPVSDPLGEMLYLRDEASGTVWSPMTRLAGEGHVRVRHGFGATTFWQQRHAIGSKLTLSVPPDDPVKLFHLTLRNDGAAPRRISATVYVEWVLGVLREGMAPFIITEQDAATGALLARNPYNPEFAGQVAFLACGEPRTSVCSDRVAFIGRNGDVEQPMWLGAPELSGRVAAGADPCGAIQCVIDLAPGEERELVFLLGQGADADEARALIGRYRTPVDAAAAQHAALTWWDELLGQVRVSTPDPELDLLLNGWLLYQTLVCRVWARSAFYQSGGAYGFRDQLQDVMALTHAAPGMTRAQILRAAARQFVEGDVQHWWHPPSGRGVRTRFSDDYLWLPFVTQHYVATSGDRAVLDEVLAFLEGRPLETDEAEYYDLPAVSADGGTLYDHCVRAIDLALGRMGVHGLPLMGAGDWNDGMNMVGHAGQGESVWVGWFLISVLVPFARVVEERGECERAARYRAEAERLRSALEESAWDGEWYLRAFYDDGTPLGSHASDECQIDSLAQSWALISGAGDPRRARQAMDAVEKQLVDREAGLMRLFTPAFDAGDHNPGYIKGYVPGVRENGGQYTHAALWAIWAWTLLGEGGKAGDLLRLISPVRHAVEASERYRVEPYVVAADVYTAAGHVGRGGWTWYTGSAGWLYRLGVEQLLGLRREGATLTVDPCLPPEWPGYEATYRFGATTYTIVVTRVDGLATLSLDGQLVAGNCLPLCDDGAAHTVRVGLSHAAHSRIDRGGEARPLPTAP
jgi:cellobiose phosphorylase